MMKSPRAPPKLIGQQHISNLDVKLTAAPDKETRSTTVEPQTNKYKLYQ